MFNSLYSKLVAALLLLFSIVGLFFLAVMEVSFDTYQEAITQELHRGLALELVKEYAGASASPEHVKKQFDKVMATNPATEIYFLDVAGNIRAFSAPEGKVVRARVGLEPLVSFLDESASYPIYGDDPRHRGRTKIFSVAPVMDRGRLAGYFYVILGGQQYDTVAESLRTRYILRQSGWIIAAGLICALLAGLILFAAVTAKLRRLASAMDAFRRGHFSERVLFAPEETEAEDEIDRLGALFNEMAERIVAQLRELEQTDSQRRDLVAAVSHDLRTPLASMRGYIDTLLLKDETLSAAERRTYLQIAAKQSERLTRLVTELFELAKLETQEVQLAPEPFLLSELIQDVVQKFSLSAENKGITLKAEFPPALPFVLADIALIERVIEKLLENALRFTPAGGSITLALIAGASRVKVRVADTGPGIPSADLPHIFERFYRAEKSRQADSGGAGLGLAIAKRIIDLHGSQITVQSAPDTGTAFCFDLPAASGNSSPPQHVTEPLKLANYTERAP